VAWSLDGSTLAAGCGNQVAVFKRDAPAPIARTSIGPLIDQLAFSSDGTRLILLNRGTISSLTVLDWNSGAVVFSRPFAPAETVVKLNPEFVVVQRTAPDAQWVVQDLQGAVKARFSTANVAFIAFGAATSRVAILQKDGLLVAQDLVGEKPLWSHHDLTSGDKVFLKFTGGDRRLVRLQAGNSQSDVTMYDAETGEMERTIAAPFFADDVVALDSQWAVINEHYDGTWACDWNHVPTAEAAEPVMSRHVSALRAERDRIVVTFEPANATGQKPPQLAFYTQRKTAVWLVGELAKPDDVAHTLRRKVELGDDDCLIVRERTKEGWSEGRCLRSPGPLREDSPHLSADGSRIVVLAQNGTFELWNLDRETLEQTYVFNPASPSPDHVGPLVAKAAALSVDGRWLLGFRANRELFAWKLGSSEPRWAYRPKQPVHEGDEYLDPDDWSYQQTYGDSVSITAIALAPKRDEFAVALSNGALLLLDAAGHATPLIDLADHLDSVWSLVYTLDGKTLVAGTARGGLLAFRR